MKFVLVSLISERTRHQRSLQGEPPTRVIHDTHLDSEQKHGQRSHSCSSRFLSSKMASAARPLLRVWSAAMACRRSAHRSESQNRRTQAAPNPAVRYERERGGRGSAFRDVSTRCITGTAALLCAQISQISHGKRHVQTGQHGAINSCAALFRLLAEAARLILAPPHRRAGVTLDFGESRVSCSTVRCDGSQFFW